MQQTLNLVAVSIMIVILADGPVGSYGEVADGAVVLVLVEEVDVSVCLLGNCLCSK